MSNISGSRLTTLGFSAIICLIAISLSSISANAQKRRQFCKEYADDAVHQNEVNEELGCEFRGSRWQSNSAAHFAWCLLFPRQAEVEQEARTEQIRECRREARKERRSKERRERRGKRRHNREGKRASCDTYAKTTVVQANANKEYECGYRGGEWIANERPHFRWCMGARRSYLADEIRYRQVQLQKCFDKLGDYDEEEQDRGYRRRRF